MRSIRVLKNVVTNYARFLLGGLTGFVLTPVMVHAMGDGDYGLWVAVFSLTGYFGLFDQGLRPSLVRYVSRDHARGDHDGLNRTINTAIALFATIGLATVAATAFVASNFTRWFRVEPTQVAEVGGVVWIAGLSVAVGFPLGVFGAVLSGLQRYDIGNWIGIAVTVARAGIFVAVLRLGGGLVELAWASFVMNLVGHAVTWAWVHRLLPRLAYGARWVSREHLGLIGAYGSIAFLGALASSIAFQTDALVITAFIGAASVTPFAIAAGLVETVRSLVHSATYVLSPTASELETRGETGTLHAMLVAGAKYSVLVSWPVLWGLLVFGEAFLVTWVGEPYRTAFPVLAILTAPTFVALPQATAAALLFGVSRHKGVVALSLLNAALNLGLSVWWARPFGVAGVAMGTAVPLALVSGVAMMVYACRALGMPLAAYLRDGMLRPGLVSLAFLVPALVVRRLWDPAGWLPLGVACAGCWAVFAACAWALGVDAGERARWGRMFAGLTGRHAPAGAEGA
uniref:Polysaccharide biosynthesis protein C-terminal domain-containing protein n=1 Tax=Eiseniibacteriota bacterium TaxID=2212470 RepID=A0A832I1Q7_UNCEI